MKELINTKYNILGIDIDVLTRDLFISFLKQSIEDHKKNIVYTPYSEFIYTACVDESFKQVLNSADLNIPDGVFVQIASIYLESAKKSKFTIINFFKLLLIIIKMVLRRVDRSIIFPELLSGSNEVKNICKLANNNNFSVYMLGAAQNVVYKAAQNLRSEFINLNIVGMQSGKAFSVDDQHILLDLKEKDPDILFVCFGGKKQERWIYEYRDKIKARVIIGLGGTFDYLSGKRKLQSKWWSDRGLNWLHRLISEPTRWKRQIVIFKLLWILAKGN